jgi:hypothetical protein
MALTPLRWMAAAIVGALLVLTYAFSTTENERYVPDRREVLAARERRLNWLLAPTADRLRASMIADSVLRVLPASRGDSMRIVVTHGVPTAAHPAFVAATRRAVSKLGNPSLPIDVVYVLDTSEVVRGHRRGTRAWITGEYVLPVGPTDRCVSVIRIRGAPEIATANPSAAAIATAQQRYVRLAESLNDYRLLGPCAFIGAFGQPGPHVADWLTQGAWGYALVAGWSRRAPKWQPPEWSTGADRASSILRNYMGMKGYACAAGDLAACQTVAVRPASSGRAVALPRVWAGRVVSSSLSDNEWWYRLNLGPRQANFLSDLVAMMGPDEFRRFWTSGEPVPQAMAAATGRSIGEVTYEWTQSQYEGYAGRGTRVPPLTAGLALLFVGAGTASAIVAARRRRVQ